jgi:hypothetical protein
MSTYTAIKWNWLLILLPLFIRTMVNASSPVILIPISTLYSSQLGLPFGDDTVQR